MDYYIQGESINRRIYINDGTSPIDTSLFLTISVKVSHVHNGDDGGEYTIAAGTLVKETPTSGGYLFFDIPPSVSDTLTPGVYIGELMTTETDTDYDSNERTRKGVETLFYLLPKV